MRNQPGGNAQKANHATRLQPKRHNTVHPNKDMVYAKGNRTSEQQKNTTISTATNKRNKWDNPTHGNVTETVKLAQKWTIPACWLIYIHRPVHPRKRGRRAFVEPWMAFSLKPTLGLRFASSTNKKTTPQRAPPLKGRSESA